MRNENNLFEDDIEDQENDFDEEEDFNEEENFRNSQKKAKEEKEKSGGFSENSIMFKIKMLMEKANSTDSPEEAQQAMIIAQKLLMKHNLDINRVTSFESVKKEGVEETSVKYTDMWEAYLGHYICQNNFCRLIMKEQDGSLSIIGTPSNSNAVLYLYEFYRNAIVALAMKRYNEFLTADFEEMGVKIKRKESHKTNFINSYIKGCVDGVRDKMAFQKKEDMQNTEIKGLILSSEDIVDKYVRIHYPNLGRGGGGYGGNSRSGAYNSGHNDGGGLGSRVSNQGGFDTGQRRIG